MTKIVCISDTHNRHEYVCMPGGGDVLIHAGDGTLGGTEDECERFISWLSRQQSRFGAVVLVAGNHDWAFQRQPELMRTLCDTAGVIYLQDRAADIAGLKFYGAPWQPEFCDWAFNLPRNGEGLEAVWSAIPWETEVLVTHGPPAGILSTNCSGEECGCELLRKRVEELPRLKLHVFGHIHHSRGVTSWMGGKKFVNASYLDDRYRWHGDPIEVDL